MSDSAYSFDATAVEPSSPLETIPAGWYRAMVTASELKPTKAGTGQYLEFIYQTCHCGCGGPTSMISAKGYPRLYRRNHQRRRPAPTDVAPGLCACGCGGYTKIAVRTEKRYGTRAGYPRQYIHGHHMRGRRVGPRKVPPCAEPLTPSRRLMIAESRVVDAIRLVERHPHDVAYRLALKARRDERDAIRATMERRA